MTIREHTGVELDVLVVEDDPFHATLLQRWLQTAGPYRCTVASEGSHALQLIDSRPWPLVVSDIEVPSADGFQILRRAKTTGDSGRVLLISGHSTFECLQQAIRSGADDFLAKPLDQATFVSRVVALTDLSHGAAQRTAHLGWRTSFHADDLLLRGITAGVTTSLTSLVAAADLLLREPAQSTDSARLGELRTLVDAAADRAIAVSAGLRSIVHPRSPHQTFQLAEATREIEWLLRQIAWEAGTTLEFDGDASALDAHVFGSRSEVLKLLLHLVIHQCQLMAPLRGGRVRVRIGAAASHATIDVEAFAPPTVDALNPHDGEPPRNNQLPLCCREAVAAHGGRVAVDGVSNGSGIQIRLAIDDGRSSLRRSAFDSLDAEQAALSEAF